MFDLLDKLRKKPRAEKKAISLIVSASITGIIFFVWLSTFWISPASIESKGQVILSDITPFASIKDNVAGVYSSLVKMFGIGQKDN